jgi:hypothetical protein
MKSLRIICSFLICAGIPLFAQSPPQISEVVISPNTVSELHLKPNYATSILMPEPVASVVLGAPKLFDEEHSAQAPELVVVKPITDHVATSNLLIGTRSGQHVSLKLISDGNASSIGPVDYVLIYRKNHDFLIPSDDPADALLSEPLPESRPLSPFETAFQMEQKLISPTWQMQRNSKQALKIVAAIGSVANDGDNTVVAFAVLNRSNQWVEILPPQIELSNSATNEENSQEKKKKTEILADQIPIREYRYTQHRLAPGARADGVVRFERPQYKQEQEGIELELATADAVNRPLLLKLPFTVPPMSPGATATREEDSDARP